MKSRRFVTVLVAGMALSGWAVEPAVAYGKGKAHHAARGRAQPGDIEKAIQIAPPGLRWGLTLEGVAQLYDKVIEQEYEPLFKKAQRTPEQIPALEQDMHAKQGVLRRSRIDFGNTPTGIDYSALKGEYSYENGESMARIKLRSGTERHFFFFNDKLWKVYDEHKLESGGPLGESFDDAVKILSKRFGTAPRKVAANPAQGQAFDEMQWRDPENVIRALDRGDVLGMVYVDRSVQEHLSEYRRHKPTNAHALDKDVAIATEHGPGSPEGPAAEKGKDDKDKSGKRSR